MNERIQELAIKSGFKKYKNDDGLYSPYIEGYDLNDEIEEFAKLIVEECLSLCENERDLQQIKEHFGVK
jgi:hypothetical protein